MSAPAEILALPKPAWVTEDVAMLYDMAVRFLEAEIAPKYEEFEKAEIFDRESWLKAGANGLLCASMPEKYGGSGGTFAHESAIIEAISHVGTDGFGIALHNSIVAPYILHYGSEDQKKRWLPRMASGELIGAVGLAPALLPFTQLPGLRPPDAAPDWLAPNTSEMGLYWEIAADHRRQGYASEAGAALIRYAFDVLNLQRIVATTTYDNTASIGVMRRLGMTIERNPLPEPIFMQVVGVLENR